MRDWVGSRVGSAVSWYCSPRAMAWSASFSGIYGNELAGIDFGGASVYRLSGKRLTRDTAVDYSVARGAGSLGAWRLMPKMKFPDFARVLRR